jgi:hypothetical protein
MLLTIMSIENAPQDNQPNLNRQSDIISELKDAQITYDSLDEFDQWTWGEHKSMELGQFLEKELLRVSVAAKAFSIQILGEDRFHSYKESDAEPLLIEGYIGYIGTGSIAEVNGFYVCLLDTTLTFHEHISGERLEAAVLIPVSKIVDYTYLPMESFNPTETDEQTQPMPPIDLDESTE